MGIIHFEAVPSIEGPSYSTQSLAFLCETFECTIALLSCAWCAEPTRRAPCLPPLGPGAPMLREQLGAEPAAFLAEPPISRALALVGSRARSRGGNADGDARARPLTLGWNLSTCVASAAASPNTAPQRLHLSLATPRSLLLPFPPPDLLPPCWRASGWTLADDEGVAGEPPPASERLLREAAGVLRGERDLGVGEWFGSSVLVGEKAGEGGWEGMDTGEKLGDTGGAPLAWRRGSGKGFRDGRAEGREHAARSERSRVRVRPLDTVVPGR